MTDNIFGSSEHFLLVVLTDAAKQVVERMGIDVGDLQAHVDNLDSIDLFKLKDQKIPGAHLAALPVNDGECTLLLKFDAHKDENHFVCIGINTNRTYPRKDERYCHSLRGDVKCKLLCTGAPNLLERHSVDAVEHGEIFAEVAEKECWRPYEGDSIEERKWGVYLDLYEKILENKQVSFCIKEIKVQDRKLCARLDGVEESDMAKIEDAKGEVVQFSLSVENASDAKTKTLGKLVSISSEELTVKLDESFEDSLKVLSIASYVEDDAEDASTEDDADAAILAEEQEKESKEQTCPMPARMRLFADFFGGLYQVGVMKRGLQKIKKQPVWQVLSGERVAKSPKPTDALGSERGRLNEEQKAAVNGALNAPELFLIWGPPGTGKTEVIMEIAKQEALRGHKTLICSQANLAVDNALARLYKEAHVYPFRIAKKDYKLEGEDRKKVPFADSAGRFFLAELQKKLENAPSTEDASILGLRQRFLVQVERAQKMYEKKKKTSFNREELRQHATLYRRNINVVGTTLMEAGRESWGVIGISQKTGIAEFDTVIIDEVSKATPPELFIPVSLGKRLVLVGDYKQLPPMFEMTSGDHRAQEEWADEVGIDSDELDPDNTIFERLWKRHEGDAISPPARAMLTKQYRMHPDIEALIKQFYTDSEGTLEFGFGYDNNDAIASLTLQNVDFCKHRPAMWIGTKSGAFEHSVGTSFVNVDEVEKVGKLLDILAASRDNDMSIGVITFYGAQLKALRNEHESHYAAKFGAGKLTFGTVDRFQGRECDVIICSLVRNNESGHIGFASKINRINVAFSRAKKALIILGSRDQFVYESPSKVARGAYNEVYKKCDKPKPKELENAK